ncbi:hypothetical protein B0H13DRAFT_2302224 [Mycena leptocephala]|nr:hypothetical protein B0H13DRAFT_2302224 [Mycena leptocephala]
MPWKLRESGLALTRHPTWPSNRNQAILGHLRTVHLPYTAVKVRSCTVVPTATAVTVNKQQGSIRDGYGTPYTRTVHRILRIRCRSLLAGGNGAPTQKSDANDDSNKGTAHKSLDKLRPIREQKGLSAAQSAGLESVQGLLLANDGGIASGNQSTLLEPGTSIFGSVNGPTLGPPTTGRPITRSTILTDVIRNSVAAAPVTATPVSSDSRPPSPATTSEHFGMIPAPPSETVGAMAKRATKNLMIIADATRGTQTTVSKLALDLGKLTVEVRLGPTSGPGHRASHSPSPVVHSPSPVARSASRAPSDASAHAPSEPSAEEDLQELFDHIDDAVERVSALEVRVPSSGGLTVAALSTALASRFQDITSDRDKLNAEIHFQAEKQAKIVAKLQLEHTELQDALSDLRLTIARLELGTPAPPLRIRDHSPARRNTEVPRVSSAPTKSLSTYPVRSRSPVAGPSAKRVKTEGFLTMGSLPSSRLAPRDFFKSLIDEALPTFVLSRYDVILDPVYEYHLRVTMDSSSDVRALIAMWETGARAIGMREMPSAGHGQESVSAPRLRGPPHRPAQCLSLACSVVDAKYVLNEYAYLAQCDISEHSSVLDLCLVLTRSNILGWPDRSQTGS